MLFGVSWWENRSVWEIASLEFCSEHIIHVPQCSPAIVHGLNKFEPLWLILLLTPSLYIELCLPLILSWTWKMNLNISGIHLGTGAFIVNKIIHLLCPVVFSRQCIDLWAAIQNDMGSSNITWQHLWTGWVWHAMSETSLACWLYYYTNHLSIDYWISYLKEQVYSKHEHCTQNVIRAKQR